MFWRDLGNLSLKKKKKVDNLIVWSNDSCSCPIREVSIVSLNCLKSASVSKVEAALPANMHVHGMANHPSHQLTSRRTAEANFWFCTPFTVQPY